MPNKHQFTLDQVQEAFKKTKTGADFPRLVQDFKEMGMTHYENFVSDGKTFFYGANKFCVESAPKYNPITIQSTSSAEKLKHALKIHQQGQTDYPTFCNQSAEAGVEKWITDIEAMTVTYLDKLGNKLTVESIPQV